MNVKMVFLLEENIPTKYRSDYLKILVWAIFFVQGKKEMSLTEKTDIRDSDEK